ncbi:MAG: LPP20 family lipoprotein [Selenomonadaceae bacterium]|nr:LPP20 family lipoprotein [Selenomonadaceae bacterium]
MKLTEKFAACLTVMLFAFAMTTTVAFAAIENGVDWERGVVRATGFGAGKAKFLKTNPGLYREQARRAATMDAQRKLAEAVEGVQVTSDSTIKDLELENDNVRTTVNAIIKGMTEVSYEFVDGGKNCRVVLEMPLFGSASPTGGNSLSEAAFLPFKDTPRTDFPPPVDATVTTQPTVINQNYTGLIIDCRGMNINCVMSPVIKNANGTKIYGHMNLDYDKIIVNGMAAYSNDAYDQISSQRAGKNPLVIKAVRLDDLNANPVVSVADADKILAANAHDRFLDNCAVVFIK